MDVLSQAKESGVIRAHGVSCHTLPALKLAAATPWVDVDLARINPDGILMDSDPATVIGILKQMKASGKGVIGMKILGEGKFKTREKQRESLKFVLALGCVDAFCIGFESPKQIDEICDLISEVLNA